MDLLVADPRYSWREWLKLNSDRDVVCLDPSDASYGPPARLSLVRGGKVREWRFVGSIYPQRNPVALVSGAARMIAQAEPNAIVLSFEMHESPVLRQMLLAVSETRGIERVRVPEGSAFLHEPWLLPVETVELEPSLPESAQIAQRRSRWLELLESCEEHCVELDHIGTEGVRLGSGRRLTGAPFDSLGTHVELYGATLLVVTDNEPDEDTASEALTLSHATKLHLVSTKAYDGLVCSFARGTGEDFGIGVVQNIDFEARTATVLSNAVAPAPVKTVRFGSLKIDEAGKETGETKPWTV